MATSSSSSSPDFVRRDRLNSQALLSQVRHTDTVNEGKEDAFEIKGLKDNGVKAFLADLLSLLLLGFPFLLARWRPDWKASWYKTRCAVTRADWLQVTEKDGTVHLVKVKVIEVTGRFPAKYTVKRQGPGNRLRVESDTTHLLASAVDEQSYHVYFHFKNAKYYWSNEDLGFQQVEGYDKGLSVSQIYEDFQGYNAEEQHTYQQLFGLNSIEVEVHSYFKLLIEEVLNPFYIFQIASMILWSCDQYVFYASCILIISIFSIVISLKETRRQNQAVHDMVAVSNDQTVTVRRDDTGENYETVPSTALVPGDVISLPLNGCVMTCDAVLVSGSCIVNESMLTGESVPVTKSALPRTDDDENYESEVHKRHTLFAGTRVIQTRFYGSKHVEAVVVRTGFSTSKGELIRSIMYPKPTGFKFYEDSMRFILILAAIAGIGMCYCLYVYIIRGSDIGTIIKRCLDIITIVVPPALPAAMTIGTYYAQSRLKDKGIFCIAPNRINMSGKIKLVCFDKTGTLTEDGLDMYGVMGTKVEGEFDDSVTKEISDLQPNSKTLTCLATCHSLTTIDGELVGDPLDIKMFESTGWEIDEPGESDNSKYDMIIPSVVHPPKRRTSHYTDAFASGQNTDLEVGIIRQFTFSSSVARMSVITRTLDEGHFEVFTKGAPEKIEPLCRRESLPENFHAQLERFTLQGLRVIGIAHGVLPEDVTWHKAQRIKRDQVEKDLTFLGFLIMQNTLKPQTTPVIKDLKAAQIRCVMVTGDNLLTAISVARDCKMVSRADRVIVVEAEVPIPGQREKISYIETEKSDNRGDLFEDIGAGMIRNNFDIEQGIFDSNGMRKYHIAMTGRTWGIIKTHYSHLIPKLIVKGTIFARMSPDQKANLVEELMDLNYMVAMCGDGANDCGALKAAHVGISLSEAEASVAAPFTSRIPDITCVPGLILEGRCALVTSFGLFRFVAMYSLIQFVTVLLLYTFKSNLGDTMFLYIDLVILTTVAFAMGRTAAYHKLVAKRPPGSLVSGKFVINIITHIFLMIVFQIGSFLYLSVQPWYFQNDPEDPQAEVIVCWETTTLFLVSSFQYLTLAAAFSKGRPYRKPMYTNPLLIVSMLVLTAFTAVIAIYPGRWLSNFLELVYNPEEPLEHWRFKVMLLLISAVYCALAFLVEMGMAESEGLRRIAHCLTKKKGPKNKFKVVQREIEELANWPPVSDLAGQDNVSLNAGES